MDGEARDDVESNERETLSSREPVTPEGLRSRPSAAVLRQELDLITQNQSRPFLVEKKTSSDNNLLPPAPSSSWSIPRGGNANFLYSPPVSTSGFYGKPAGDQAIAQSPHLLPGQARTAVGALVAKQQSIGNQSSFPPLLAAASSSSTGYEGDGDGSANQKGEEFGCTDWEANYCEDEEANYQFEDGKAYYQLEKDPIQQSRTPPNNRIISKQYISPMTVNSNSFMGQSPGSLMSRKILDGSVMASPSSLMGHKFLENSNVLSTIGPKDESSVSSRAGLIRYERKSRDAYDFGLLEDTSNDKEHFTEVVVADASDQTHISAMSQSLMEGDRNQSIDIPSVVEDEEYENDHENASVGNDLRSSESLVFAAIERLQDDIQLVMQVEEGGRAVTEEMGDWFAKTEVDKAGILTGFEAKDRKALVEKCSEILQEMNSVAQPEEFLPLSPTEIPQYSETHSDLYKALQFVRSLILMAIPSKEQAENMYNPTLGQAWKIDEKVYKSMNLIPQSPEACKHTGGDTSIFTLPSESADTPMTSNLSVSSAHNDWSSKKKLHSEGVRVLRTIELLATHIEKISRACRQWIDKPSTRDVSVQVQVTRDIKRHYLQLIGIPYDDLCMLIHSFQLVRPTATTLSSFPHPAIAQLVSCDEDDTEPLRKEEVALKLLTIKDDDFTDIDSNDVESVRKIQPGTNARTAAT